MHPNLANGLIKSVRLRNSQGDCPTEPALSVEQLEDLAMHFADAREWQPIDTAPQDGTRVLVYAPAHLPMIGTWLRGKLTYHEPAWWSNNVPILPQPTLWMPLPIPPTA